MSGERISCIIPAFNAARYIGEAIESVLGQGYEPLELIVVDDGSTDGTGDVARAFGHRLRLVSQANGGPAAARNAGLRIASGSFLAFLDADDRWLPGKLERQMRRFRQRPELDMTLCCYRNFLDPTCAAAGGSAESHPSQDSDSGIFKGGSLECLLARRRVFDEIGGFDATVSMHAETAEWFCRAEAAGAVIEMTDDVLAERRLHEANMSRHFDFKERTDVLLDLVSGIIKSKRRRGTEIPASRTPGEERR